MSCRFIQIKASAFLFVAVVCFAAFGTVSAQGLPSEIRGYKVVNKEIVVTNTTGTIAASQKNGAAVRVGRPDIVDFSLTGITLAVSAELDAVGESGDVHFMVFRDFQVNGVQVEVEEYKEPFSFKKNQKIALPTPATIFLPARQLLDAAWKEIRGAKKEWAVTGQVLVFGKFKKFGFSFKRAVPVSVRVKIPNPLTQESSN